MRALITGVNGFVGIYLSEYLIKNGIEVWGTKLPHTSMPHQISSKIIVRDMDIINKENIFEIIKECMPDYIFHLAAQSSVALSWENPQLTININVNGTLNLLDAVRKSNKNIRILLIGSSEEYGIVKSEIISIDEDYPLNPTNPYAVSKMVQEYFALQYINAYKMDIIMVRAFNHIGPGQAPTFVVPDFAKKIAQIEKGLIEPVLFVGNLEAERDFTDVRDIVRAYFDIITAGKSGQVYNVGSNKTYKISYILDLLLSMSNKKIIVKSDPSKMRPLDVPVIRCDNKKLVKLTSWSPQYKIEDTIKDVLNYWRINI
ncbi:GDP-4-dehydro-6-deoxy-D-mannose reductase [Caloramator quimbayensis]|uniref:GDP-4-dehydro-6-deoxy-D-mannose reductase n=1 Tax=Caloramator quimbayensis TaxID=1147123 RepID=A0A1T4WHG3_9CLOT|nr:GDP-4-dehydro-6-deoxy-D-mannose reductase [Caloramator quimbayensis]